MFEFEYQNLQGNSEKDAEVVKGNVQYLGSVDLIQYYIASYQIIDKTQMNTEQVWTVQVCRSIELKSD